MKRTLGICIFDERYEREAVVLELFMRICISAALIVTISLFHPNLFAAYAEGAGDLQDQVFQTLQNELKKEKHRRKVLGRFEKEGLQGLSPADVTLTLLNYSYHDTNGSKRLQALITVKCVLDLKKLEKKAKALREETGITIELPESIRTVVGVFDHEKDEFITLASAGKYVKPVAQLVHLRKTRPEYIIVSAEPDEDCNGCPVIEISAAVFGFDRENGDYKKVLDIKTYEHVMADGPDGGVDYIDKSTVSWSDWRGNAYRELIVTTQKDILRVEGASRVEFKQRKDVYGWRNDSDLYLVERYDDGKRTINLRRK